MLDFIFERGICPFSPLLMKMLWEEERLDLVVQVSKK